MMVLCITHLRRTSLLFMLKKEKEQRFHTSLLLLNGCGGIAMNEIADKSGAGWIERFNSQ